MESSFLPPSRLKLIVLFQTTIFSPFHLVYIELRVLFIQSIALNVFFYIQYKVQYIYMLPTLLYSIYSLSLLLSIFLTPVHFLCESFLSTLYTKTLDYNLDVLKPRTFPLPTPLLIITWMDHAWMDWWIKQKQLKLFIIINTAS